MSNKKRGGLICFALAALLLLLASSSLNKITGFAVLDENSTNESTTTAETTTADAAANGTTTAANETLAEEKLEKEKPEKKGPKPEKIGPNKPPIWNSDLEEFVLKGKTTINLSRYFYDEDGDNLSFTSSTPEKISATLDNNLVTLVPEKINFTTTIKFTASDLQSSTKKEIKLVVPEKSITNNLQYKTDSAYDIGNNGYESTTGIIDFTADNSEFSWDANKTNLCIRWNVYSIESQESTTLCYGNSKCCNFVGLEPTRANWDAPFYSVYGQYGNSLNTIVSAQILYVDYSVSPERPYAEIYYSDWKNLTADYYFASIDFENVCVDTCFLNDFNLNKYTLIFEIDNAILTLDKITYLKAEEINNVSFVLTVKDNEGAASGSYQLYKNGVAVPIQENLISPDYYDIEIIPISNIINKLIIKSADITGTVEANVGLGSVSREISAEDVDITKKYSTNFDKIKFEKAVLRANASGNSLFKCRQWDFEREICFGTWEKIQDLISGEEYEVTLDADSNGFIEGNSNITLNLANATLYNTTNITLKNITANITNLVFLVNMPNITIASGSNASINLSQHFLNTDDATLFSYYKPDNITIFFEGDAATIVPDNNFAGIRHTFIIANKSNSLAVSNLFSISAVYLPSSATQISALINITDPSMQLKLKEYAEINLKPIFKYNTTYFTGYEIKNDVVIIYTVVDNKNIKWFTSLRNFNEIILSNK
ncbi:MAG: hypothetical protein AABX25_03205 [Nanoarchaeota archaeon]|mgnify:CR=1 FL=1